MKTIVLIIVSVCGLFFYDFTPADVMTEKLMISQRLADTAEEIVKTTQEIAQLNTQFKGATGIRRETLQKNLHVLKAQLLELQNKQQALAAISSMSRDKGIYSLYF